MTQHIRSILDLQDAFRAEQERTRAYDPFVTQLACANVLVQYVQSGGPLNVFNNDSFTETEVIFRAIGPLGLSTYIDLGGKFAPSFRDKYGNNEFMRLLHATHIKDVKPLIETYFDKGGQISPEHRNETGQSETITVIEACASDKIIETLEQYFAHGGKFSQDAKTVGDRNELQLLADRAGLEGVKFFFANGGKVDASYRNSGTVTDNTKRYNEMTYLARTGAEGLQLFLDHGGKFNENPQNGELTDAMAIAFTQDLDTLKFFVENGGRFFPQIKNSKDFTEAMLIAEFIGGKGIDLYIKHGGTINPYNEVDFAGKKMTELDFIKKAYGGTYPAYITQSTRPPKTPYTKTINSKPR